MAYCLSSCSRLCNHVYVSRYRKNFSNHITKIINPNKCKLTWLKSISFLFLICRFFSLAFLCLTFSVLPFLFIRFFSSYLMLLSRNYEIKLLWFCSLFKLDFCSANYEEKLSNFFDQYFAFEKRLILKHEVYHRVRWQP